MTIIDENEIARCVPLYGMVISSVEKPLVELVMKYSEGNQTRAAELLGINRNTLRNKIRQYRIK